MLWILTIDRSGEICYTTIRKNKKGTEKNDYYGADKERHERNGQSKIHFSVRDHGASDSRCCRWTDRNSGA